MDWGDANSRFLGLVSEGASTIIRSNGIKTVCHQNNPSNNVKHIMHIDGEIPKTSNSTFGNCSGEGKNCPI